MRLSKKELSETLSGLLPLLIPMEEMRPTKELIYFRKGTRIQCDKKDTDAVAFVRNGPLKSFPVNHENRLKSIISSASNKASMIDGLSKYVAKNGNRDENNKVIPYESK